MKRTPPPLKVLDEFHKVKGKVLEALGRGYALHEEAEDEGLFNAQNDKTLILWTAWRVCTWKPPIQCITVQMSIVCATNIIMNMCFYVMCEQYIHR